MLKKLTIISTIITIIFGAISIILFFIYLTIGIKDDDENQLTLDIIQTYINVTFGIAFVFGLITYSLHKLSNKFHY